MPTHHGRLLPVLVSALLLVGAANLGAYAATGKPLVLGKNNSASKTTKLKTTGNGAALKLKSKPGKAPLKVSNPTKIKNLNADLVDGLDGETLRTKAYTYNLSGGTIGGFLRFALPGLPAGRYVANFAVSAELTGSPAYFGCVLESNPPTAYPRITALGDSAGDGDWHVTGGGLIDTTSAPYSLACISNGATTVVPLPSSSAHIVLTQVDDLTTSSSTGAPFKPVRLGRGG